LTGSVSIKIPSKKQFHIGKESITRIENDLFFRPDSQDSLAEATPRPSLKLRSTLQLPETIPKLLSSLTIRENLENRLSNDEKLFLNLLRQKTPSEQEALIRKVKECDSDKCELEVIDHLEIGILYAGSSFGELALISDKPRSASVQARERSSFLVLTKTDFKKILGSMSENKLLNQVKFLQRVHYFQNWSKSSLTKIAYYFDTLKFKKNQPVYKEGDQVEGIYFIREGEIVIEKKVVCKAETPSVFSSSPKHFAVKAVKKTRIVNDVKIIIKSKFEAFGGLEVCDRLDRRQFSAVCASALSEVLFIKKEDFLNRVPN
jgi:CRP-like cAMP-binding protein